jgi:hypothetical protein
LKALWTRRGQADRKNVPGLSPFLALRIRPVLFIYRQGTSHVNNPKENSVYHHAMMGYTRLCHRRFAPDPPLPVFNRIHYPTCFYKNVFSFAFSYFLCIMDFIYRNLQQFSCIDDISPELRFRKGF